MNGIHFISGLPRSGSTLLSGILRQNPLIYAHISSPVSALVATIQQTLSGRSEFHPLVNDDQRLDVMRSAVNGYYASISKSRVVIDTSRAWTGRLHILSSLFPDAKVICCVRPLAWIVDSFERIVQENPLQPSRIYNFSAAGNVFTRCEHLNSPKGVIGSAFSNLKDGFYGRNSHKLILVPYDILTWEPQYALKEIYSFLGLPEYKHDFDNVVIDADEFDRGLGTPGLHAVRRSVRPLERIIGLPPELIARFAQSQFWGDPNRNPRGVRVLRFDNLLGVRSQESKDFEGFN